MECTSFNILDKSVDIHRNYLLEASAGTGKTFTIEHLVVRLLIEGNAPPTIDQILVVTFTRAATRELKMRIRQNIEKALGCLRGDAHRPDYLIDIEEKQAVRRLENAIYCFDQAQVFTIHGFCLRMLVDFGFTANMNVEMPESENPLQNSEILRVIRDFFRTELSDQFTLAQIKRACSSIEKLENELLQLMLSGKEIEPQMRLEELLVAFQNEMIRLKALGFSTKDFCEKAPNYKGVCDRSGNVKPDVLEGIELFGELLKKEVWAREDFDLLVDDQLSILKAFDPHKRKSKCVDPCPLQPFFEQVKKTLFPLICDQVVFARMARMCQLRLRNYLLEVEKFRFDDLLVMMQQALCFPRFCHRVRSRFFAAIIDEFQDTDPIQWEIFQTLFLHEKHRLYLVGDPKQSIYAFRQADIYTYLSAAKAMGADAKAHLQTNYRSQPSLIHELNALFSKRFLTLPKWNSMLEYLPVKPAPHAEEKTFYDNRRSVNFAYAEETGSLELLEQQFFFPFIVQEIQSLVKQGMAFSNCAALVADRFQAMRLSAYLTQMGIPCVNQRETSLIDSKAYAAMREVLQAVMNPKDMGLVKRALGGQIFGWTHDKMREEMGIEAVEEFYELRNCLQTEGFGAFFVLLMEKKAEGILMREEGDILYQDLCQIAEVLIEKGNFLRELDQFYLYDLNDETFIKRRSTEGSAAVQIMTIHSSKGLEFDIVFLPGLMKRKSAESSLFLWNSTLIPFIDKQDERFQRYCQEIDAEKMRQLYVAMTRAKYRLYVPAILHKKEPEPGSGSPLELFFKHVGQPEGIQLKESISLKKHKVDEVIPLLQPPKKIEIPGKNTSITSFSALAKDYVSSKAKAFPMSFSSEDKTPHTLPAGSETGTLLHDMLERLPLEREWKVPEDFLPFVKPFLAGSSFEEWDEVFCTMLYHTLYCPIDEAFCLAKINPKHVFREIEFLYEKEGRLLKGFIDFIFMHENKYYLVDWKSNWVGETIEDYQRENLEHVMHQHDYFLQGKIYRNALKKYLELVDPRPFDDVFGGIYYLFIRGLQTEGVSGIYHFFTEENA